MPAGERFYGTSKIAAGPVRITVPGRGVFTTNVRTLVKVAMEYGSGDLSIETISETLSLTDYPEVDTTTALIMYASTQ